MGIYQSSFEKTDAQAILHFNPAKADWITGHADLTGLAVVEVERLWFRFKQMGADKNGFIPAKVLEKAELSQDIFVKNILGNLPKERDGSLSFVVYLRLMQWAENSDIDSKLKVIYNFINNGKELDSPVVAKLFSRVYSNISNDELRDVTELFMTQMDERRTGRINENQFVYCVKRIASPSQLKELLKFDLIPPELLDEINMQPSVGGSMISVRNSRDDGGERDRITDEQLDMITNKIIKKNWEKLLLKLGYLEYDIETCKAQNRGNLYNVVLELLRQWRDQDPFLSTPSRLKRYLEECGMIDAALVLDS